MFKALLLLVAYGQFTVNVVQPEPKPEQQFTVTVTESATPVVVSAKKPVLCIGLTDHCEPCKRVKRDIDNGLFSDFEITWYENDNWSGGYPVIFFRENDQWMYLINSKKQNRGYDSNTIRDLKQRCKIDQKTETVVNTVPQTNLLDDMLKEDAARDAQISKPKSNVVLRSNDISTQGRYYSYGGSLYDLETYTGCSSRRCGMCAEILAAKAEYFRRKNQIGPQAGTPLDVIDEALTLASERGLTSDSCLVDLGCGIGDVLIATVKRFGCRAIGVEIDPNIANEARRRVSEAGLSHLISVITGDALTYDLSGATCVYCYLYPDLLEKLAPKLTDIPLIISPFHEIPTLGMIQVGDIWIKA